MCTSVSGYSDYLNGQKLDIRIKYKNTCWVYIKVVYLYAPSSFPSKFESALKMLGKC